MSTLIAPCAGLSSRYGSGKPKYLYTSPEGTPIFFLSVKPLLELHQRIIFVILLKHEKEFNSSIIIKQCFKENGHREPEILIINEVLNGPAFTVAHAIKILKIEGSITIKDCDSICKAKGYPVGKNAVSFIDATKFNIERLNAKSSLELDEHNKIISIKEKIIFSKFICVGSYYFSEKEDFLTEFNKLKDLNSNKEIFISHVIDSLIYNAFPFVAHEIEEILDLGTLVDYYKYLNKNKTIFCDLDGTLFKNRGRYGLKTWKDEPYPLSDNIKCVNNLVSQGAQLIITTSRPELFREITEKQLQKHKINYSQLIMGLNHSTRVVINDYANSNPFPSAQAINIARNYSLEPFLKLNEY